MTTTAAPPATPVLLYDAKLLGFEMLQDAAKEEQARAAQATAQSESLAMIAQQLEAAKAELAGAVRSGEAPDRIRQLQREVRRLQDAHEEETSVHAAVVNGHATARRAAKLIRHRDAAQHAWDAMQPDRDEACAAVRAAIDALREGLSVLAGHVALHKREMDAIARHASVDGALSGERLARLKHPARDLGLSEMTFPQAVALVRDLAALMRTK